MKYPYGFFVLEPVEGTNYFKYLCDYAELPSAKYFAKKNGISLIYGGDQVYKDDPADGYCILVEGERPAYSYSPETGWVRDAQFNARLELHLSSERAEWLRTYWERAVSEMDPYVKRRVDEHVAELEKEGKGPKSKEEYMLLYAKQHEKDYGKKYYV